MFLCYDKFPVCIKKAKEKNTTELASMLQRSIFLIFHKQLLQVIKVTTTVHVKIIGRELPQMTTIDNLHY